MTRRAARAVSGMVESGFLFRRLYWNCAFRQITTLYLPADGPLTAEKGTSMIRQAHNSVYWFPFRDTGAEVWQPALSLGTTRQITLNIFFGSQEACESFITNNVFMAAGQLGQAVDKVQGSSEDTWDF